MTGRSLLAVRDLRVSVRTDEGKAEILDYVDLTVEPGQIVGIAGESGCGKSTLIKAILGLLPRGAAIERGQILFDGENLLELPEAEVQRRIRGSAIGFIPQDPFLAFNPVFKVGTQLLEIMHWHASNGGVETGADDASGAKAHRARLIELLKAVQVPDAEHSLERYPHQFSGGQRQRLLIAGALACRPKLILADEPTTALDVTTQLEILRLLKRLSSEFDVSMLFVTHDFGVLAQLCDSVAVMYAGQSVETGPTSAVIEAPKHPYTRMLMNCHPDRSDDLNGIPGQVPTPLDPPAGCRFNPRCPEAIEICRMARPDFVKANGQQVACVHFGEGRRM